MCGDKLASASNLAVHMRNHIGDKPFACDLCDKSFASLAHMQQHKEFHRPTKDFECDICGKKYQTMNALSQHKADFHSEIKYHYAATPLHNVHFGYYDGPVVKS